MKPLLTALAATVAVVALTAHPADAERHRHCHPVKRPVAHLVPSRPVGHIEPLPVPLVQSPR